VFGAHGGQERGGEIMAIVKFTNSKGGSVGGLLKYITDKEKTEAKLISGKDCVAENAAAEFQNVKLIYGKTDGRQYVHIVQSFSPNDNLDYKTAHEIGCKLAEYFEEFQAVIATHKNCEHIHNHLLLNTVNFETGKKFHQTKAEMQLVKDFSNQLCKEHGLTECPVKSEKKDYKFGEYYAAEKGQSWKFKLMSSIDEVMAHSRTKTEFMKNMNKLGYGVNWTDSRKYITYTTPDGQKCRDNKLHEDRYLKERACLRLYVLWGFHKGGRLRALPVADEASNKEWQKHENFERERERRQCFNRTVPLWSFGWGYLRGDACERRRWRMKRTIRSAKTRAIRAKARRATIFWQGRERTLSPGSASFAAFLAETRKARIPRAGHARKTWIASLALAMTGGEKLAMTKEAGPNGDEKGRREKRPDLQAFSVQLLNC